MNKNILLAIAAVAVPLISFVVISMTGGNADAKVATHSEDKVLSSDAIALNNAASVTKVIKKDVAKKADASQKPVYNIRESVHLDDVYEPADITEMKTKLKAKPKVEPIAAFTMPKGTIRKLYYGDTILLPDIAGHDYELKIEKRTIGKSGSVILEASVGDDGSIVKSVLTEGERTSYITLNTADGVYELESINGNGFVYSSADIKNQLIDYSKTDAVIPPHTTHK